MSCVSFAAMLCASGTRRKADLRLAPSRKEFTPSLTSTNNFINFCLTRNDLVNKLSDQNTRSAD